MHPTPLRVDKIAAILNAGFGSTAFPIYVGGAGDGQSVRRQPIKHVTLLNLLPHGMHYHWSFRWQTSESLDEIPYSHHVYQYAYSNPILNTDPSGKIVPVCPIGYRRIIKDGQFAGCEDDPDFPSWLGFLKGSVGPMPVGGIAAGGTLPQAGGQAAGEAAKQALGKLAEACGTLFAYWLGQQVQTNVQTNTANPQNNRAITVFRGERASMTPQIAFTVGITPKGGNTNLIEHLTTNTANSYYIATSKSLWIAFGYAGKNGYVYVIRTSRGIDINQVLGSAAPYPEQQEVSIPGGVFPSEIAGAMPKQQGVLTGQFIPNPGFILR